MKFSVEFTTNAKEEAETIREWISNHSASGADRWTHALRDAVERLESLALDFALAPESVYVTTDVREVSFKTRKGNRYRALYVIRETVVFIVSVRGKGQDFVSPDVIVIPE